MTLVCLDTEFLDDGRRIEPVSLALVCETAEYYGICADSDITAVTRHAWLRANVVPHLPIITEDGDWRWDTAHPDFSHVKPRAQIAHEVHAFFANLPTPETWAYFSPFDTIVLCQLFGPMSDLPPEIPAFTLDLMQEARRYDGPLPAQPPPVHHALHDARHDLLIAATIGLTALETDRGQACMGLVVNASLRIIILAPGYRNVFLLRCIFGCPCRRTFFPNFLDHGCAGSNQGKRQSRQAPDDCRPSVRSCALKSKPGNPVYRCQNQEAEDDDDGTAMRFLGSLDGYLIPTCPPCTCTDTKLILPRVWHRSSAS